MQQTAAEQSLRRYKHVLGVGVITHRQDEETEGGGGGKRAAGRGVSQVSTPFSHVLQSTGRELWHKCRTLHPLQRVVGGLTEGRTSGHNCDVTQNKVQNHRQTGGT